MIRIIYIYLLILVLVTSIWAQKTLSVLYFENTKDNPEYQWLHKGLADMLITDLAGTPGIKIIERESLEKILNEQALSLSGLMEDNPAIEVGKLLQAEILVYGTYLINDDNLRVDLRITEVGSANIISAFHVLGDPDDLIELTAELAIKIRESLSLKTPPVPKSPETQSVEALAEFYKGLDLLDHQRYEEAQVQFKLANKLDPLFYKAQKSLADSYKFLKAFKEFRQQREIAELYLKVNRLEARINSKEWVTFSDIVQSPQYQSMSMEEQQKFNNEHNEYLLCQTRAQCIWHTMITLWEIGNKTGSYFADKELERSLYQSVVSIGDDAREKYRSDSFFPEILYFRMVALYSLNDYKNLKESAEEFMINHPDFRMIETVEDYYQKALDKQKQEQ